MTLQLQYFDTFLASNSHNTNIAPLCQVVPKNRDLRCVLHPAPEGACCKTRLESRIKMFTAHVIDDSFPQARCGDALDRVSYHMYVDG